MSVFRLNSAERAVNTMSRLAASMAAVGALCVTVVSSVWITACSSVASTPQPLQQSDGVTVPRLLSETGLYDADGDIDPRNKSFEPQYPLWTDGAAKSRWVFLPEGTKIDVTNVDIWKFPVGAKFWKEFAFNGKRVETRMIWKVDDTTWRFASYAWNAEQTEAYLAPSDGLPSHYEFTAGKSHSIPSEIDCMSCHMSSPAVILGFSALQLSDDRDPLTPHQEALVSDDVTLKRLIETGKLNASPADWLVKPPRIRTDDPTGRAAMGYLSGNCGGCHNSSGSLARLGMNLLHNVGAEADAPEPAEMTLINAAGRFLIPGVFPDSCRIVSPGIPEHSALLYRMNSRRPSSQMPPLGTVVIDSEAVALVQKWIEGLATDSAL